MPERGFAFAAEHACDFFLARFARHFCQARMRPPLHHFLRHDELRRRSRGHLRQVRDAKHLMIGGQLPHLFAHRICDLAANIRVDFVKHQKRNRILRGQ